MAYNKKIVGRNIKELRKGCELTQKQLSEFLSIDQSTVSKIESGDHPIQSDALEKLAALFCCTVQTLLSEEPPQKAFGVAFRAAGIDSGDLAAIAVINKIAMDQFQMDGLS